MLKKFFFSTSVSFSKIALVAVVFTSILFAFYYFAFGGNQSNKSISQDPNEIRKNEIYTLINKVNKTGTPADKASLKVYMAYTCFMAGEGCAINPQDPANHQKNNVISTIANGMAYPIAHPPASSVAWVYDGLQHAGFVPKTYAAEGIGFGSIEPFSGLWKSLRDICYLLIVLVMVAIGFMIMFRMKLNPQTVISIENSLPRIVISLILITFSFAIAGFLIDIMYVVIAIVISVLSKGGGLNAAEYTARYFQADPMTMFGEVAGGSSGAGSSFGNFANIFWVLPEKFTRILGPVSQSFVGIVSTLLSFIFVTPRIYDWLNSVIKDLAPTISGGVSVIVADGHMSWDGFKAIASSAVSLPIAIGVSMALGQLLFYVLMGILITLTVFFVFFRLFFMLLKTYIKIILLVIAAPLFMLLEGLPGRNTAGMWVRNLLAELLTFPSLIAIFMIGHIISQQGVVAQPGSSSSILAPPFLFGIDSDIFTFLMGMSILFMAPELVKMIKAFIVPKPAPFPDIGPGIFFGGAGAGGGGALGLASRYLPTIHYAQQMPIIGRLLGGAKKQAPAVMQPLGGGGGGGGAVGGNSH